MSIVPQTPYQGRVNSVPGLALPPLYSHTPSAAISYTHRT